MGSDAKACSMRRRAFSLIRVRARPGSPTRGILLAGPLALPVVLGRGGIRANKFEGDGATPRGRFRPIRLWWRADRHRHPPTLLPARRITPDLAWCEDTTDRRYNRPFPPPPPGRRHPPLARRPTLRFHRRDRPQYPPPGGRPWQRGLRARGAAQSIADGGMRGALGKPPPTFAGGAGTGHANRHSILGLGFAPRRPVAADRGTDPHMAA